MSNESPTIPLPYDQVYSPMAQSLAHGLQPYFQQTPLPAGSISSETIGVIQYIIDNGCEAPPKPKWFRDRSFNQEIFFYNIVKYFFILEYVSS